MDTKEIIKQLRWFAAHRRQVDQHSRWATAMMLLAAADRLEDQEQRLCQCSDQHPQLW